MLLISSYDDYLRENKMTNETINNSRQNATYEAYAPFGEIVSQEAFNRIRDSKIDYWKRFRGFEKFEGFSPDLETAIEIITSKRTMEPWLDYETESIKMGRRCPSEVNKWDGSATKFQVGDNIVSLNLSLEYLSDLREYARNIGEKITCYGKNELEIWDRGKFVPFLNRYIALEAIIPFLNQNSKFAPKSQPYFNTGNERYSLSQRNSVRGEAVHGLKYVIVHRNLLGINKEPVLQSAVDAAVDASGINAFGYAWPDNDEAGHSNYFIQLSRDTLRHLIKEEPRFEWINEKYSQVDGELYTKFKNLSSSFGIEPPACLLAPDPLWGAP